MSKTALNENSKPIVGSITPPGDKSISHRAIMIGALANGSTKINGFLNGEDTLSTLNAFRNLGVQIELSNTTARVKGKGLHSLSPPKEIIDAGNSGTTARLLIGILSGQKFNSVITGDKYLRARPMARVVTPLTLMGASIKGSSSNNLLPLTIIGSKLRGITYRAPVSSAQLKSCLIFAALFAEGETQIEEQTKTRDHTERMLLHYGVPLAINGDIIKVSSPSEFAGRELTIPADISSAAFFIVLALINKGSELLIRNIGLNPGRVGSLEILKSMGANIHIENSRYECGEPVGDLVVKHSALKGITIQGEQVPKAIDELPIIAVAACFAEGQTVIKDARELRVKETDRIKAMSIELRKLNADISETDDGMIINGKESLQGNLCSSHGDHRVAMSLAIASTRAKGNTVIQNSDCVNISYPNFFHTLFGLTTK